MKITNDIILTLLKEFNIDTDSNGNFLDIDSIRFISLIVAVEELLGAEIPPELLAHEKCLSVSQLFNTINSIQVFLDHCDNKKNDHLTT